MADPNTEAHNADVEAAAKRSETHEAEEQGFYIVRKLIRRIRHVMVQP